MVNDIDVFVFVKDFLGKGVIDWESWRLIFERNIYELDKFIYINEFKKLVKFLYLVWNFIIIDKMVGIMFEELVRYLIMVYICIL